MRDLRRASSIEVPRFEPPRRRRAEKRDELPAKLRCDFNGQN
jgi:hypothetical protein